MTKMIIIIVIVSCCCCCCSCRLESAKRQTIASNERNEQRARQLLLRNNNEGAKSSEMSFNLRPNNKSCRHNASACDTFKPRAQTQETTRVALVTLAPGARAHLATSAPDKTLLNEEKVPFANLTPTQIYLFPPLLRKIINWLWRRFVLFGG